MSDKQIPPGATGTAANTIATAFIDDEAVSWKQWIAVFGAVLGAFMAILDIQITNAAIRDVTGGLGATIEDGSWISTSYLVAEIIIIPLSAWLTTVLSLKTYLQWTSGLFVFFSILCGLSWNLPSMIVFRALQGITGGALIPLAFQVILSLPPSKRALGQTIFGITATFAPAIGPTFGGYLTDKFHWSIIFYLNIIPGIIQFLTIQYSLEKTKGNLELLKRIDIPGILSMGLGLGALTVFLEEGERKDWFGSNEIIFLGLLSLFSLMFFFVHELRTDRPFINLRLLARRNFGIGCVTIFALGVALYGALFLLPLYLSTIQGYSSFEIGRTMMWAGFPQLLVLPFLPKLMKKVDLRILTFIGLNLFAVSCFMNSRMTHETGYDQLFFSQLVRAFGQPLIMIPLSTLTTGLIEKAQVGSASSLFNMLRNLGGSVGIAMLSTIVTVRNSFHYSRIGESISIYGVEFQQRMQLLTQAFIGTGSAPAVAHEQAVASILGTVARESYVMSMNDGFKMVGIGLIACSFLMPLASKVKAASGPSEAH